MTTPNVVIPPRPKGLTPSPLYEVRLNGKPVFVHPCQIGNGLDANGELLSDPPEKADPAPAAWCSFDFSGRVAVEVSVKDRTPRSAVVRPLSQDLVAEVSNGCIRFMLDRPAKLSIEPDGDARAPLFLFARPLQTAPDPKEVTLFYGPGIHEVGVVEIPSDSTVYLAAGALVRGHLACTNVRNVRIFGRGTLSAAKSPGKRDGTSENAFGRYMSVLPIRGCHLVRVEGIQIMDSPGWTCQVLHSQRVQLRDLAIVTWRENGDGIDFVSCEHCTASDSFLRTWDDCLVVKGLRYDPARSTCTWSANDAARLIAEPCRDIHFLRCAVWCDRGHALEIGLETAATEITDILFDDIDIIHDRHIAAIDISNGDGAVIHGIRFRGIRIEDCRSRQFVRIYTGHCYTSHEGRHGPIRDLRLEDLSLVAPHAPPSTLRADSAASGIAGVVFDGLSVNGARVRELAAAGFTVGDHVEDLRLDEQAVAPWNVFTAEGVRGVLVNVPERDDGRDFFSLNPAWTEAPRGWLEALHHSQASGPIVPLPRAAFLATAPIAPALDAADAPWYAFPDSRGRLRFAVSEDRLLIEAEIHDPRVRPGLSSWPFSQAHVYVSHPLRSSLVRETIFRPDSGIGRVFCHRNTAHAAETGIVWRAGALASSGWRLAATVELASLDIPRRPTQLLLDAALSGADGGPDRPPGSVLFGSRMPWCSAEGFARAGFPPDPLAVEDAEGGTAVLMPRVRPPGCCLPVIAGGTARRGPRIHLRAGLLPDKTATCTFESLDGGRDSVAVTWDRDSAVLEIPAGFRHGFLVPAAG